MSYVPGPNSRSPSLRTGIRSSVPSGQTVSMWPIRSWNGAACAPARSCEEVVAHPRAPRHVPHG